MKEGYAPLPRWVPSSSFCVYDLRGHFRLEVIVFTFVGHVQVLHPFTDCLCFVFPPFFDAPDTHEVLSSWVFKPVKTV